MPTPISVRPPVHSTCAAPRVVAASAAALCALLCAPAQAAPTVFFGLDNANVAAGAARPVSTTTAAAFAAAAGPLAQQNFEGAAFVAGAAVPDSFAVGSVGVSFNASATDGVRVGSGVNAFSAFGSDGGQYIDALSNAGSTYYSFSFDQGVSALGFYLTDLSDWAGDDRTATGLELVLLQGADETVIPLVDPAVRVNDMVNGNLVFVGVVDAGKAITGFRIVGSALNPDEDALGLDQLMVAPRDVDSPLPLPATGWMLLAGLALAGITRRRPGHR